jgi:hypothetical protein
LYVVPDAALFCVATTSPELVLVTVKVLVVAVLAKLTSKFPFAPLQIAFVTPIGFSAKSSGDPMLTSVESEHPTFEVMVTV